MNITNISTTTNSFMDDYQIGSILNKNLLIRNMALMRNIGRYSLYDQPMFPAVGMTYNVYEHTLNRPMDIGSINGLIGYNNSITSDDDLISGGSNRVDKRFRGIPLEGTSDVMKTVYVTNSDSVVKRGGEIGLTEAMKQVNERIANERYIIDDSFLTPGFSIDKNSKGLTMPATIAFEKIDDYDLALTADVDVTDSSTYIHNLNGTDVIETYDERNVNGVEREVVYSGPENVSVGELPLKSDYSATSRGWLLDKTNKLFSEGKINSIIRRDYSFYDEEPISRGRNLLKVKKDGTIQKPDGTSYDNPYCRVWTVERQYSKMTDLIRPRLDGDNFADIKEIQAKYGDGLRPYGGASRLSDMSVLKPNGMVNITPHKDKNGNFDSNAIKKYMFSIENLAWKDVMLENSLTRWEDGKSKVVSGPSLTKEQQGPNGGRIMWFPPYNLKFSEDVTTEWNSNTFIGRGEKIYTYVNTERAGSLSFTLLIDHPSVINKWKEYGGGNETTWENEQKILRFFAGCDDLGDEQTSPEKKSNKPDTTQTDNATPKESSEEEVIKAFIFFPNNYTGKDEVKTFADFLKTGDGRANRGYEMTNEGQLINTPIVGKGQTWYYLVDNDKKDEALVYFATKNTSGQWDKYYKRTKNKVIEITDGSGFANNGDNTGFTLNGFSKATFSPSANTTLKEMGFIDDKDRCDETFFSFQYLYNALKKVKEEDGVDYSTNPLYILLNDEATFKKIKQVKVRGFASSLGVEDRNRDLAFNRAKTVAKWINQIKPGLMDVSEGVSKIADVSKNGADNSGIMAKAARSVVVEFYYDVNKQETSAPREKATKPNTNMRTDSQTVVTNMNYDDEYLYFKDLSEGDSFIKNRIVEKIQYFDPAFHSITPEGFNARLTFLQQCTRQGPTLAASDINNKNEYTGVGNLAFGRAPYCVLRIGDFYNTKILIENVSIQYDGTSGGVQWDLNPEGVGVQPMMAEVTLRFKFIGGADISGPIERLQNAVSYNYYSNTSIYDRRADYRGGFMSNKENPSADVNYWNPVTKDPKDKTKK